MSLPPPARSRAESQAGSRTTSRAGVNPNWMEYVRWDGEFRSLNDAAYNQLPEVKELRELVKKSFTVPAWIANIESPQLASYKSPERLGAIVQFLSDEVSTRKYIKDKDDLELSVDVQESLPFILHIRLQVDALQKHASTLEPMEADRRHPVDTLGSLVWDRQSDGLMVYRAERKLAIPHHITNKKPNNTPRLSDTQPDACAFITMLDFQDLPVGSTTALSCFPRAESIDPEYRYALHWVTEFKRDHDDAVSKSQVVEGLVSALYQRRAFGFPNHFVFGTAHHSRTVLEVLAATWVPSDEPVDTGAPSQEANTKNVVPPENQSNDTTGNLSRGDDPASDPPKTGERVAGVNANPATKDIMKYNKIVVYSIAKYSMLSTPLLLELYLLMRHTRALAQQYKNEIMKDGRNRIRQLLEEAKEFYQWSPPPRPKPAGPKRQKLGSETNLAPMAEEEHGMYVDSYQNSDSGSGSDSEEPESLSDAGPMRRIRGEVGSYTLQNYAYEEDVRACVLGDQSTTQTSVHQTA
ncbi:hypothetical protein RSAG8_10937, partial [Rhizoctonia solani AG-8 WAC10335]